MEQAVKEKKSLSTIIEEHPRTIFISRAIAWFMFAGILPFLFIAYRFQLFHTVSKIQIGGWGIIGIIIIGITVITFLKYVKIAMGVRYSYFGQVLKGFFKVIIPLLIVFIIAYNIRNNLDLFLQAMGCVICCETVAIFINPFPKWIWDLQKDVKESERKEGVDYLLNEIWKRKDGEK